MKRKFLLFLWIFAIFTLVQSVYCATEFYVDGGPAYYYQELDNFGKNEKVIKGHNVGLGIGGTLKAPYNHVSLLFYLNGYAYKDKEMGRDMTVVNLIGAVKAYITKNSRIYTILGVGVSSVSYGELKTERKGDYLYTYLNQYETYESLLLKAGLGFDLYRSKIFNVFAQADFDYIDKYESAYVPVKLGIKLRI
ncbi:hypothetical protein ACFL5N_00080 [bacterium]